MVLDQATLERVRGTLYTAVISDVLDGLGYRHQATPPWIRPLDESTTLFGRARTGLYMDTYSVGRGENPYEVEIALIDDLKPDEVAVLACGKSGRIAPWGELLTTASRMRGAVGCLTDGLVRDVRRIREMEFAVFCGGIGPLDSAGRGKMMAMDTPVECAGVSVRTGDYVFGDVDGCVVIPQEALQQTLDASFDKVAAEDVTRAELLEGKLLADVYAKYGVL